MYANFGLCTFFVFELQLLRARAGQMDKQTDRRTDRQTDGRTDGRARRVMQPTGRPNNNQYS